MATNGNKNLSKGIPKLKDAFVVIVKTEWNSKIVNALHKGCINVLQQTGINYSVLTVPGAVEIPFAVKQHYTYNPIPDAYIVLGAVVKGDTPHFDYVCQMVSSSIAELNIQLDSPVIFGVLTVNTIDQALERIGGIHGHKGEEAAVTAIKMIGLNRKIKKQ